MLGGCRRQKLVVQSDIGVGRNSLLSKSMYIRGGYYSQNLVAKVSHYEKVVFLLLCWIPRPKKIKRWKKKAMRVSFIIIIFFASVRRTWRRKNPCLPSSHDFCSSIHCRRPFSTTVVQPTTAVQPKNRAKNPSLSRRPFIRRRRRFSQ